MLDISPRPLSAFQLQLGACLDQVPAECQDRVTTSSPVSPIGADHAPNLQLSYDEISAAEVDRLLGYAGISSANAPIGLDADFTPRAIGPDAKTQFLLFPLAGLEAHLVGEEPQIAGSLETLGSMEAFIQERGDSMSAVEYLTAGLLTCIKFCRTRNQALIITW